MHGLDDGTLGLLPTSELKLLKNVQIYGRLDSHGNKNAVGTGKATVRWLVWSVSWLPSDRDGTVVEAVAA